MASREPLGLASRLSARDILPRAGPPGLPGCASLLPGWPPVTVHDHLRDFTQPQRHHFSKPLVTRRLRLPQGTLSFYRLVGFGSRLSPGHCNHSGCLRLSPALSKETALLGLTVCRQTRKVPDLELDRRAKGGHSRPLSAWGSQRGQRTLTTGTGSGAQGLSDSHLYGSTRERGAAGSGLTGQWKPTWQRGLESGRSTQGVSHVQFEERGKRGVESPGPEGPQK